MLIRNMLFSLSLALVLMLHFATAALPPQQADAQKLLRALVATLTGKPVQGVIGETSFAAAQCPRVPPQKWLKLFLMNEPIVHKLSFARGCDLQGDLRITQEPFPVKLEVRNFPGGAKRVEGMVSTEFEPNLMEQELDIQIRGSQGKLSASDQDADLLKFGASYALTLGMLDGDVKENRGGKVKASIYRGSKVDVEEKILLQAR